MLPSDIPAGLRLCRAAGWNQLERDWEALFHHDSQGLIVAAQNDDDVVGTASVTRYQDCFSWLGMVLVAPTSRRQGIGTRLVRESIERLPSAHTIKLDATPAGREVYRPLGFVDDYGLVRLIGRPTQAQSSSSIHRMTAGDLQTILHHDVTAFGGDRSKLLHWWRDGAPEYAWFATDNQGIVGYCLGRHGFSFDQIGPVIAVDMRIACDLVLACSNIGSLNRFAIDVPVDQSDWVAWLLAHGFAVQRELVRMVRGPNVVQGDPRRHYAIMGLEVG